MRARSNYPITCLGKCHILFYVFCFCFVYIIIFFKMLFPPLFFYLMPHSRLPFQNRMLLHSPKRIKLTSACWLDIIGYSGFYMPRNQRVSTQCETVDTKHPLMVFFFCFPPRSIINEMISSLVARLFIWIFSSFSPLFSFLSGLDFYIFSLLMLLGRALRENVRTSSVPYPVDT